MTKFSILFLSSPLGFCVALRYCKLITRFKMLFPLHSRGRRTVQTSTGNVRCAEKATPPHRCTARGQPVDSMSLKEWIIKAILTLLLQHCKQHENSLLISYFITCFSVLFFLFFFLEIQLTERRSSAAPRTSIIHCGFFHSGFLGVPVNIKDLGAADRPDVLHRSHLTDLSGIEPVPPPLSDSPPLPGSCELRRFSRVVLIGDTAWEATRSENKYVCCYLCFTKWRKGFLSLTALAELFHKLVCTLEAKYVACLSAPASMK